jgi:hypothetical protein
MIRSNYVSVFQKNYTHVISVFDPEDLLSDILKIIECGLGCDGVDQYKSLAVLHIEISHGSELFLYQSEKKI